MKCKAWFDKKELAPRVFEGRTRLSSAGRANAFAVENKCVIVKVEFSK